MRNYFKLMVNRDIKQMKRDIKKYAKMLDICMKSVSLLSYANSLSVIRAEFVNMFMHTNAGIEANINMIAQSKNAGIVLKERNYKNLEDFINE